MLLPVDVGVTGNLRHFTPTGVQTLDPWSREAGTGWQSAVSLRMKQHFERVFVVLSGQARSAVSGGPT
jgi:hypothetical protein